MRALIASGEISQDSARQLLPELANLFAGPGSGAESAGRPRSGGLDQGGQTEPGEEDIASLQRETRRAVVFIMAEDGTMEPRGILIGLNDWDFTEVVSGLQEGDLIAIVGAAQLRASQDQIQERMRQNSNPFGGGRVRGGFR